MSGGENAKFLKLKERYLDDHLIIIDATNFYNGSPKGIYEFDLAPGGTSPFRNKAGKKVKYSTLRAMSKRPNAKTNKSNAIVGYYLPYLKNASFHHRLVDDVDFCFTDTMNGCTFCVGSGAKPLISHYNFADDATQLIDQAKIDRHIGRRYQHGVTTLKKNDYKHGGGMDQRVTMIGFRQPDKSWSFVYQRRATDMVHVPGKGSKLVEMPLDQSIKLT